MDTSTTTVVPTDAPAPLADTTPSLPTAVVAPWIFKVVAFSGEDQQLITLFEEDIGDKVNDVRAKELVETGADRVAVACPFCYVMMDDGVKAAGKEEDEVRVADIAITVLEAIETGEAKSQAASLASQTELASLSLQRPADDGGVTTQD